MGAQPNNDEITDSYITQVAFRVNGELIAEMLLGKHVAQHPVVGTEVASLSNGDRIEAKWQDMGGDSGNAELTVNGL